MFQNQVPVSGKTMHNKGPIDVTEHAKRHTDVVGIGRRRLRGVFVALVSWFLVAGLGTARADEYGYGFAVFGVIEAVSVKPGQAVSAGDVLARLDDRVYKARLKTASSALDLADNAVTLAHQEYDRVKQRYDDLAASGQALEQADVALRTAQYKRTKAAEDHIRAQWDLDHAVLRAPVSGKIAKVSGYAGLVVDPAVSPSPIVVITTP